MRRVFSLVALPMLLALALPAAATAEATLDYRGFTVDMSPVANAPNRGEIETSFKKQLDIVADCGAKPEIMAFFRKQKIKLEFGHQDGGGHFSPGGGVVVAAEPQDPQKPVVLHEFLHALHALYLPNGANNADILKFYNVAVDRDIYPAKEYVMKNKGEYFAVTGSLYLWGFVARPPNNRETLRKNQPVYYQWLGQLFGVQK